MNNNSTKNLTWNRYFKNKIEMKIQWKKISLKDY